MHADDGNSQFACAYEATHVEEATELEGIVSQLVDAGSDADAEKLFNRYHQIVCPHSTSSHWCRLLQMGLQAE